VCCSDSPPRGNRGLQSCGGRAALEEHQTSPLQYDNIMQFDSRNEGTRRVLLDYVLMLAPTLALLAGVAWGVSGDVFAFFAAGAASLSDSESLSLSESEESALRLVPLRRKK